MDGEVLGVKNGISDLPALERCCRAVNDALAGCFAEALEGEIRAVCADPRTDDVAGCMRSIFGGLRGIQQARVLRLFREAVDEARREAEEGPPRRQGAPREDEEGNNEGMRKGRV